MLTMTRLTAAGWVIAAFGCGALAMTLLAVTQMPANASSSNEIADRFDVEIVWSIENCRTPETNVLGCFLPNTPDAIYVLAGQDAETERYVILHEIGHVIQHRMGQKGDECKADQFALSMGATMHSYEC